MKKQTEKVTTKPKSKALNKALVSKSVYCDCKPYGIFNSVGVCVMCKRVYHP